MIRFSHFLITVFCLFSLLMAFEGTAHAYADPGSGLLALQIIGSTLAGVGFYCRQKVGRFFMRRQAPVSHPDSNLATPIDIDPVASTPE